MTMVRVVRGAVVGAGLAGAAAAAVLLAGPAGAQSLPSVPLPVPTLPTGLPTAIPTALPTALPTAIPTALPTGLPTALPTAIPTALPTAGGATSPFVPTTASSVAAPGSGLGSSSAVATSTAVALPRGVDAGGPPSTDGGGLVLELVGGVAALGAAGALARRRFAARP